MSNNILQSIIFCLTVLLLYYISSVENIEMVYREIWIKNKAVFGNDYTKLHRPIKFVVIIDVSAERDTSCYDILDCNLLLQDIYEEHKEKWSDIGYNFLIGGDGKIYEGKGWYGQGFAVANFNDLCISIAYVGNLTETRGYMKIRKSIQELLYMGTEFRFLSQHFKFVTSSQIKVNNGSEIISHIDNNFFKSKIYNLVKTLPSWLNGTVAVTHNCVIIMKNH